MKKISLSIILLVALFSAFEASAWQAPTSTPPVGNTASPLNISSASQAKIGGLILNTGGAASGLLIPFGKVGIGTLTPGGLFEVFTSSAVAFTVLSNGNVGVGVASPTTKFAVNGGVQIGTDTASCVVGKSGTLRWNSGAMQICDGTNWVGFSSSGGDRFESMPVATKTGFCRTSVTVASNYLDGVFASNVNSYDGDAIAPAWVTIASGGTYVCHCSQGFDLVQVRTESYTKSEGNRFGPGSYTSTAYSTTHNVCDRNSEVYSAEFPTVLACMNPDAVNYNYRATTDDGSCHWNGCMVQYSPNDGIEATNYHPNATNPISCVYRGCMDSGAENYQIDANEDDGSCDYGGGEE